MTSKKPQPRMKRRLDPWPSRMCGLLSSDLRRELLVTLGKGPMDVSSLADHVRADMGLVSRNLGALLDEGLLEVERDAKRRLYSLSKRVTCRREKGRRMALRIAGANGHVIQITQPRGTR